MPATALLAVIETSAEDILILTEGLHEQQFFRSRLTHARTIARLRAMAATLLDLPAPLRDQLVEIDWESWQRLACELAAGTAGPVQVWVAIQSLTPNTLQWLRLYRSQGLLLH